MNPDNVIGGGMIGSALAWMACLLVLYFVHLPRVPNLFTILLYLGSGLTSAGVGIAILAGGIGPFGITISIYAVSFVVVQFFSLWGFAVSMLIHVSRTMSIVDTCVVEDTNARVREMQTRGKGERAGVVTDQTEGHEHRLGLDEKLDADTELRKQEREDDRQERAEERREDREERADERHDSSE